MSHGNDYKIRTQTAEQWQEGELNNVVVTPEGELTLADGVSEGYRISPAHSIHFMKSVLHSRLLWRAETPTNTEVKVFIGYSPYADVQPTEWYEAVNGEAIPELPLKQQLDGYIFNRIELTTSGSNKPKVGRIEATFTLDTPYPVLEVKPIDPLQKALLGSRVERFRYELLDRHERHKTWLRNVEGGELEVNFNTELKTTGYITIADDSEIDYLTDRVRIYRDIQIDGEWREWELGVFLLSSPEYDTDGILVSREVELYSKLLILQQDLVTETYVVDAGVDILQEVKDLIQSTGESLINIEEAEYYTISPRIWEAGTSKLRIINDLLISINFTPLWVDGAGFYRAETYRRPERRPIVWEFLDDSKSVYEPDVTVDTSQTHIPNRIILVTDTVDEPPVIVVKDLDSVAPDSEYTFAKIGRWITRKETTEEAPLEVIEERAERMLLEGIQRIERVSFSHIWLPADNSELIYPQNAIRFRNRLLDVSARYTIQSQKIRLEVGGLVTTEVRRTV